MPQQVLFRESLGDVLRSERMRQGMTLRQLSKEARVSLGYISEIERGQKEASSELLGALCEALDIPLSDVLREVSDQIAVEEASRELRVVSVEGLSEAASGPEVVASAA
jgi:transcriptional regulator with XRE-family HTH domain